MNLLLHCETDTKASAFRKPTLVKKSLAVSTGEKLLNVQNCKQLMEEDGGGGQDAHEINIKLTAALFLIEESALEVGHAREHLPAK